MLDFFCVYELLFITVFCGDKIFTWNICTLLYFTVEINDRKGQYILYLNSYSIQHVDEVYWS